MSFGKESLSKDGAVTGVQNLDELDYIYDEFDTSSRLQTSTAFCSDEVSMSRTPSTARLNTRGRPPTRQGTTMPGFSRPRTDRTLASRCGTARPIITGATDGDKSVGLNRPLTAIRGAGYTPALSKPKYHGFDPLNMGDSVRGTVELEPEETQFKKIQKLEARIWELVEESIMANHEKKLKKALELAKEAELKDKVLQKQKEEDELYLMHDWDLTYSVIFNLALQYEENELFSDALSYYHALCSERFSSHGPAVKLNMGNIYVKQCQYEKGIKMYRMALDQLGHGDNNRLRIKLFQNMGSAFILIGDYADAVTSFETIMVEKPSFEAAFNLVVANCLTKDIYATKTSFQELLQIPLPLEDDTCLQLQADQNYHFLLDAISLDSLSKYGNEKRKFGEKCVLTAARLIAPIVDETFSEGYDWVIDAIKNSQHSYFYSALEISKSVYLIKEGRITQAITLLHEFEQKESKFFAAAANNLSFIYFQRGDFLEALKYGELAVAQDSYNDKSFVNFGNSLAAIGKFDRARTLYFEAIRIDSFSIEAMYNLGLVDQKLGNYENAVISFMKILKTVPRYADVLYQVALMHELMQNYEKAIEYYLKTLSINQHDCGVFKKLGRNAELLGNKQQAFCYFSDALKCNPSDVLVVKWLAIYMIESGLSDEAMELFRNGLLLNPNDPVWLLSMATCQKRLGNAGPAVHYYKSALELFPDHLDALEGLIELSRCLDKNEAEWYRQKLERAKAADVIPEKQISLLWEFSSSRPRTPVNTERKIRAYPT